MTVRKLKKLKDIAAPDEVLRRARGGLLAHMDAYPMARSAPARFGAARAWKPLVAGIVSATVLSAGGGAVLAAQSSLPGDALYEVKIAAEEVRANLAFSEEARYRIRAEQAERRLSEAQEVMKRPALLRQERERRLRRALKRYDQHLFDLNVMAVHFGAEPPGAETSVEAEASLDRVLERHEDLVESATDVDEETAEAILRPISGSLELESNVLDSAAFRGEAKFKERLQKRSERLRERLERHEAEIEDRRENSEENNQEDIPEIPDLDLDDEIRL